MARPGLLDAELAGTKAPVAKILWAALRVLERTDADRITMQEIAAEAGVSKALIHYHFKSKDDLFLELVDRMFAGMTQRVAAVTASFGHGGTRTMAESLEAIRKELRSAGPLATVLLRLAARATVDKKLKRRLVRFRERVRDMMSEGIRNAVASEVKPFLPVLEAAEVLLACLIGFEVSRLFTSEPERLDRAYVLAKGFFAGFAGD